MLRSDGVTITKVSYKRYKARSDATYSVRDLLILLLIGASEFHKHICCTRYLQYKYT